MNERLQNIPRRHPGDVLRVFVSATSADLKSFRVRVRDVLESTGQIYADTQEIRPPGFKAVQETLQENISLADAVSCIVGHVYGHEPKGHLRRSYTQLEFDIASGIPNLPVFLFVARENATLDDHLPELRELRELQTKFRAEVQQRGKQYTSFASFDELEKLVRNAVTANIDAIWKARIQRRRSPLPGPRPTTLCAGGAAPDAWKHAVALVTCGGSLLGSAFSVVPNGRFLLTSEQLASSVATALIGGKSCHVRWENHPQGRCSSAIENAFPNGALQLAGSEPAAAQLIVANPIAARLPKPGDVLTALVAAVTKSSSLRVQIERVVGEVTQDAPRLTIFGAVPELDGSVSSGAPLINDAGEVVAVAEESKAAEEPGMQVVFAKPIEVLRCQFPTLFL